MIKKVALSLALLLFTGLGAAQFVSYPVFLEGQACCPDRYNNGDFVVAVDYGTYVKCYYSTGAPPFSEYYCQ